MTDKMIMRIVNGTGRAGRLVVCALALGCVADVREHDDELLLEVGEGPDVGTWERVEERTLFCGHAWSTEPEDTWRTIDEVYYPDVIQADLAGDPALRERFGADRAETCSEARKYAAARLELMEEKPTLVAAEVPPTLVEEGIGVSRAALWGGVDSFDTSVVAVFTPVGACSGVAISPRHILTAAHCLGANTTTCGSGQPCSTANITVRKVTGLGTFQDFGPFTASTYRNENYGGLGDPGDDIGLISLPSAWNQPTSQCRPIWLNSPVAGDAREISAAWGSTTQFPPGNFGIQKQPPGDRLIGIDWSTVNYFLDDNDGDVNTCSGDSGSPAFTRTSSGNPLNVQGLLSEGQVVSGRICTIDNGHKQRWMTVGQKMAWLETRLRNNSTFTCPIAAPQCCQRIQGGLAAQCF